MHILTRLSAHLDKMAGQVLEVEEELGSLISAASGNRQYSISKVQLLDYIRQSLEDCALLTHILSDIDTIEKLEGPTLAVLSAKLRLSTTRDLVKPTARTNDAENVSSGGIVDLF